MNKFLKIPNPSPLRRRLSYDSLPAPLRQWLSEAALPWSPTSARRIWAKSLAKGMTPHEALQMLSRAESKTLARDKAVMVPSD